MKKTRYWIRENELPWQEVTREQFIRAERKAGFHPKDGSGVATASFSSSFPGSGEKIQGRTTKGKITKKWYDLDKEFFKAAKAAGATS